MFILFQCGAAVTVGGLINSALYSFKGGFSRGAALQWFVVLMVSMMVRTDSLDATSVIRALGLRPSYEPLINNEILRKFIKSGYLSVENLA